MSNSTLCLTTTQDIGRKSLFFIPLAFYAVARALPIEIFPYRLVRKKTKIQGLKKI